MLMKVFLPGPKMTEDPDTAMNVHRLFQVITEDLVFLLLE